MSVTVVLVLELQFKFISDDSDKNAYSFPGHWQREAGLMFALIYSAKKAFFDKQSLVTEASSGKELSMHEKVFPTTADCF